MVSPVFVELRAATGQFMAKMGEAEVALRRLHRTGATNLQKLNTVGRGAFLGVAAGAAVVGVASVKMAADFQQSTNLLLTSAGESQKNIAMVRKGLLDLSVELGSSANDLAKGMYYVESAGYHGAEGLNVLKAASQGAKAEGANFETVANALTSALNAYKIPASQSVSVTNQLVATVAHGKMRMEELSAAIGGVLPVAASAHLSLAQVGGAMATMTQQGTPAAVAATYLRQTIGQLENPSKKARNEMTALGLSATDIAANLGHRGLTGTLDVLTNAIEKKMGPSGILVLNTLRAAGDNSEKFQSALNNLPPAAQTAVGALATMVGGVKTMQAALQLGGAHSKTFRDNVAAVAAGAKNAGKNVNGWEIVQKNFNQKLAVLHASLGKVLIQIGNKLIPIIEKASSFISHHTTIVATLAGVVGGVLLVAMGSFLATWIATNLAFMATPIGAIITGIVALVAALVYAWKHSETFRNVVLGAWHAVQVGVGNAVAAIINYYVRPMVKAYLWLAKTIVGAINSAFGWIPGLGGKLKKAKKAVDDFAHDTDQTLKGWADSASHWGDEATKAISNSAAAQAAVMTAQKRLARDLANDAAENIIKHDQDALASAKKYAASIGKDASKTKAKASVAVDTYVTPGFVDTSAADAAVAKATAARDTAAERRRAAEKKRREAEKKAREELKRKLKEEADLALAQAARIAAAREAQLKKALAAAQEAARQLAVANKLAGGAAGSVDIVDGAVLNRGTSFAQLAGAGRPTKVVVNVAGNVTSESDLLAKFQEALQKYGRTNIGTGIT